jgi:hypothetical protein
MEENHTPQTDGPAYNEGDKKPAALSPEPDPQSWFKQQLSTCIAFLTFVRFQDLWAALYSIFLVVSASLWFGRLPKMPVPVLVFIPFVYLSLLGALLLLLGIAREKYIGNPKTKMMNKFLGPQSVIAGYFKRDGARMLRSAFGVGVYLFAGLLYYAAGPEENPAGWLLMPFLLIGMVAIFSLSRQVAYRLEHPGGAASTAGGSFSKILLKRGLYMVALAASLFAMYYFLIKPLKSTLLGE